jgi:hypothetical protein
VRLDVVDRFLHGRDLLGRIVGDLDREAFLERHDQFHSVEGIRAQIVDEGSRRGHLRLVHAELLDDDLLNLFFNRRSH